MATRIDAKDAARDLALEGLSATMIQSTLESRGLGGHLDQEEIAAIVIEVTSASGMLPPRPSRVWPRIVGVIAILMGLGGIFLGEFQSNRYSPNGYGLWAIILGSILVIKPGWSNESIK